jgi:DNA-binding MarR family transcriptional regulator
MPVDPAALDLGYLALFVGMRVNDLVLDRLHAGGFADARIAHGYVFQHLIEGPRSITELAKLLGVTQQAASKSVADLVARGYLKSTPGGDRRARQIELSERGRACIAFARDARARIERRLVARHGATIARTRALLADLLDELGGGDPVRARRIREPGT